MFKQVLVNGGGTNLAATFLVAAEAENNASGGLKVALLKKVFHSTHDGDETALRVARASTC